MPWLCLAVLVLYGLWKFEGRLALKSGDITRELERRYRRVIRFDEGSHEPLVLALLQLSLAKALERLGGLRQARCEIQVTLNLQVHRLE